MPEPEKASVVSIEPTEPYPTGAPPSPAEVVARVHTPQEITEAVHWQAQSEANLAAGGLIPGGAAVEPPEPEVEDVRLGNPQRGTGRKG